MPLSPETQCLLENLVVQLAAPLAAETEVVNLRRSVWENGEGRATRTMKSLPATQSAINSILFPGPELTVVDGDSAIKVGEKDHLRLGFHVRKHRGTHCSVLEYRTVQDNIYA